MLKIHHITGLLPYQKSTTFKVIVFFRIFAFGPLNFSHFAPNIHLFRQFCCEKYPKFKNNSFFVLQAENSPHNWSIAVSKVHNFQSYHIFRIFAFGPLNFPPLIYGPLNIHLFHRFCRQKYPKFENNSFFILQAENSPHNWSIAVSNVHNVQSYLIFPNFCFWDP